MDVTAGGNRKICRIELNSVCACALSPSVLQHLKLCPTVASVYVFKAELSVQNGIQKIGESAIVHRLHELIHGMKKHRNALSDAPE